MTPEQLEAAIAAIDAANAEDPTTIAVDGRVGPKELLHAELVTQWVRRLDPGASPEQLVAARAHHLRRWTRPRADYPDGRAGYLRWRADAKAAHANEVARILEQVGVASSSIERVGQIIRKERLRDDPQVQTHEDALCLTFLQTQLDELIDDHGEDKTVTILAKTARKMSPQALKLAGTLPLSERGAALLRRALG
jgi:hypothetical protein